VLDARLAQFRCAPSERLGGVYQTLGLDELQASPGARSEPVPLLHPPDRANLAQAPRSVASPSRNERRVSRRCGERDRSP
jgi:hypothetical protein